MEINFWLIMGILLMISAISFLCHYRFGRISNKFKGKKRLYIISFSFFVIGLVATVAGFISM